MRIVFVGSEATPFAKTGGLADVLGSLPKALAKRGHDVELILPMHRTIKRQFMDQTTQIDTFDIPVHTKREYVGVHQLTHDGVCVTLIDNDYYFGARDTLYGHYDDGERYGFFNQAVLAMFGKLKNHPDILHLNDWQTGMIPFYLATYYEDDIAFKKVKTVFTIHNIAYQGHFDTGVLPYLNAPEDNRLLFDGHVNFLKTGIVTADKVTTVSKTYAEELMHEAYAEGMHTVLALRRNDFLGIMNGIDLEEFDPRRDPAIAQNFGLNNYLQGKRENKKNLVDAFNLIDENTPLIGVVSRLTEAKGFPIVEGVLEKYLEDHAIRFVLLGSGDANIESYFDALSRYYPGRVAVHFGYSDALARQIYAASDFFLMPSRTEPCGLAQLIAMRYGTLPIVHETGGLKDSVLPYNKYTHDGTGFSFFDYSREALGRVLDHALELYHDKKRHKQLMRRVMKEDFGWDRSATRYVRLYEDMMEE